MEPSPATASDWKMMSAGKVFVAMTNPQTYTPLALSLTTNEESVGLEVVPPVPSGLRTMVPWKVPATMTPPSPAAVMAVMAPVVRNVRVQP
jgi:hypothetical protein